MLRHWRIRNRPLHSRVIRATVFRRDILHRCIHEVCAGVVVGGWQLLLEIVHENIFVIANHDTFSVGERYRFHKLILSVLKDIREE